MLRKRFDSSTEQLEEAIRRLDTSPAAPDAFSVRGYQRILEEAERLIRGAQQRLVISGWPREIEQSPRELKRAAKRRVYIVVFSHAELPPLPGEVFSYGLDEKAPRGVLEAPPRRRRRRQQELLIGATEQGEPTPRVVSETTAIAEIATSQVALDITLLTQRTGRDIEGVMAKMLGARVGRLDTLLSKRERRETRGERAR